MGSGFRWGKNIVIALFAVLFLIVGIETLIGAFLLKNPLEFVMVFFSACFIVLVSVAGILYPSFQMHTFFKNRKNVNNAK
jgi:hypothetical protein